MRRFSYYFNETVNGLRRHGLMVFAAVSTVFISLFLFGGAILIQREVNLVVDFTTEKVEVAVYLQDNISDQQLQNLNSTLLNMPEVDSVKYESKKQAYERFQRIFANQENLTQNVSPDALPASFRVKLKDPEKFEVVKARLTGQPGIESIQDQRQLLKSLFAVSNILRNGALVAAVVVLLSAAGLIGNTVRMAVFSRRREIGIMRLVGATNWFIRIPFLIEAMVQAMLGALAAIVTLIIFRTAFLSSLHQKIPFLPVIATDELWTMIPILLAIGMAVAFAASFIAMRRFLEV